MGRRAVAEAACLGQLNKGVVEAGREHWPAEDPVEEGVAPSGGNQMAVAASQVLRILGEDRVEAVEVHNVTGLVGDRAAAVDPVLDLTAAEGAKEVEEGKEVVEEADCDAATNAGAAVGTPTSTARSATVSWSASSGRTGRGRWCSVARRV